jgi:hypothetical protein
MKMFKRTILALSVAALTIPGVALAQESATLTLRNGDRVSGQLVDMGGAGFSVRVNGQERQIPTNDVAVIDFTGGTMSDADWAKKSEGSQLLWLKSGETINGTLYDIGGTAPLKITFKTTSGDREFSSSEIGRIILARPTNAVATSGSLTAPTGTGTSISPKQAWTSTGLTVRKGDVLTFRGSGEIQLSSDASDVANGNGSRSNRRAANAPLPNVAAGMLIGRVGNGQPFPIGEQATVTMPADGQLFLGINDDGFDDNQGEMRVEITRTNRR